jgi:2-polyprenyl-3-methyl-5-hydroxy-6-metoxy-1,4-benzoquinol methylase
MPSSLASLIEPVLVILDVVRPKRVLDIGPGHGKYGLLAREYIPDIEKLDAVEIWPPYINTLLRAIYDTVYYADIRKFQALDEYDMFLMIDVIEHMPKPDGLALLERMKGHLALSTPSGFMPQGAIGGNPHERHVSGWRDEEFSRFDVQRKWSIRGVLLYHIIL